MTITCLARSSTDPSANFIGHVTFNKWLPANSERTAVIQSNSPTSSINLVSKSITHTFRMILADLTSRQFHTRLTEINPATVGRLVILNQAARHADGGLISLNSSAPGTHVFFCL